MFMKASTPVLSLRHSRPILVAAFSTSSVPPSSRSSRSSNTSSPHRCCAHSTARSTDSHALARRCYATTSRPSGASPSDASLPPWPSTPNPTPYDVLGVPRKGPYTKKRFYQLVKLYHPDIHTHAAGTPAHGKGAGTTGGRGHGHGHVIPPALRLERYHLIVAANDILSDPEKRRMYDTYGSGWAGSSAADELRARDRSWRDRPGNASMNATWEDWERWHKANNPNSDNQQHGQDQGQKQGPPGGFYMPNSVFAALIALLCTVGALAQGRRAETSASHYLDVTSQQHQNVSQQVMRSASATRGLSQEERVARFLKDRESVAWQYEQHQQPPQHQQHQQRQHRYEGVDGDDGQPERSTRYR